MSSQKTHIDDMNFEDNDNSDNYEDYDDYDDFSVQQNIKSKDKKNNKTVVYSSKHVRNYTKRYNK